MTVGRRQDVKQVVHPLMESASISRCRKFQTKRYRIFNISVKFRRIRFTGKTNRRNTTMEMYNSERRLPTDTGNERQ